MRSLVAYVRSRGSSCKHRACTLLLISLALLRPLQGQTNTSEGPIPILTGSAGFFSNVNGGHSELVPIVSPLLLVPFGDRWLVESRAEFKGKFEKQASGSYAGQVEKEIDYLQLDYIANPFLTVTVGRFLTPFGIYNERLYPAWIRNLPSTPLIFPIGTGSSDGAMLRGGFPVDTKINLNYAVYFSALSTINKLDSDRTSGARMGIFLPGPRLELGASFQKLLQEDRSHSVGLHLAWQPNAVPLASAPNMLDRVLRAAGTGPKRPIVSVKLRIGRA